VVLLLESGHAQTVRGKKYALLVGVCQYDSSALQTLDYPENDVEELSKLLNRPAAGFASVRVLTNKRGGKDSKDKPTAANIRAALKELLKGKNSGDTVLLALAGHGVQLEVKDPDGKADSRTWTFFCPKDADLTDVSYRNGHSDTLLNLDDLFQTLGDSNPGVKLVLVDACRSQFKVKGNRRSLADGRVTVPDGVLALFSCGKRQFSYESHKLRHGVFFYFVLEALRGKAKNDEGEVTWDRLSEYVRKQVPRSVDRLAAGAKQTPALAGYHEGESPILVAREKGAVAKADKEITNSIGMKLVRIPSGTFTMGSPKDEAGRKSDEDEHTVEITRPFYLGECEVTQAQYAKVMGSNPSYFSRDGAGKKDVEKLDTGAFPVDSVSWEDAVAFCKNLSELPAEKKAARRYRLPTEAEWEYACRGGARESTVFHFGNSLTARQANFARRLGRTAAVGSSGKPNAFGLSDLHGNVAEWCADHYDRDYYRTSPKKDPAGPALGERRVVRGGSWQSPLKECRCAARQGFDPSVRNVGFGFRVVCVPSAE
jgi:formylglycine-generating enzyme required for sulfatase activity